jgi:DNA modification methylase
MSRPPPPEPGVRLILGDCLEVMRELEAGSVDAIVTDPPAGIAFMGKEWDNFAKGGRGSACRKTGSGNPCASPGFAKDVHWEYTTEARDRFIAFLSAALAECYRLARPGARMLCWAIPRTSHWTGMAIEDAGWRVEDRISHLFGTGFPKHASKLKPACEDWWLAHKPAGKAVPLQIDRCRIEGARDDTRIRSYDHMHGGNYSNGAGKASETVAHTIAGRWPANVVLDEAAAAMLDEQSGERVSGWKNIDTAPSVGAVYGNDQRDRTGPHYADSGGASRFYYCAKASRADRGEGNTHPTCKSTALMRWLCRLITPPGGLILDPFAGSGSTGCAAVAEGFDFLGIESDPDYFAIAEARLAHARGSTPLFA